MYMLCVMNTCVHRHTTTSSCLTYMAVKAKQKDRDGSHGKDIHGEDTKAINQLNPSLLHQASLYPQIYSMGWQGRTLTYSSCVGSWDKSRQHKLSFAHLCSWFGASAALSGAGISPNPSLKKLLELRTKRKTQEKCMLPSHCGSQSNIQNIN